MPKAFLLAIVSLFTIDVALFVGSGWELGWWAPLSLSFLSFIFGLGVIAYASWRYGAVIAFRLDNDECLTDRTLAGLFLMLAGFLLLTPGPITDACGLILLFPTVRLYAVKAMRKHLRGNGSPKYA
jgi:UPF0716 protein FxsA